MRWGKPGAGDKRVVRRLALFPIRVGNEFRWLEFVRIEQTYYDPDYYQFPWHNTRFVEDE